MLNTGTDESTAMKITGHRTASIFKRYRIVNLADMQRAVERLPQAGMDRTTYLVTSRSEMAK